MMKSFITILSLSFLKNIACLRENYVNSTVVVMLSLEGEVKTDNSHPDFSSSSYKPLGPLAFLHRIPEMLNLWKTHLAERAVNDLSWPVNISVEFYDVKSDPTISVQLFVNRTKNTNLPLVSTVIGPEYTCGSAVGLVAMKSGMPVVLVESKPFSIPSTSFFVIPHTMHKARSAVDLFIKTGVKSVVIVMMWQDAETYNIDTCGMTGDLFVSRGIHVTKLIVQRNITLDGYFTLISKIRDDHNPDVIMFCDWESCQQAEYLYRNPLYAFKRANYLPKALLMMDCNLVFENPKFKKLYEYVTTGLFTESKCIGSDYTEEPTPFSSYFRPKNAVNLTFTENLNVGWIPQFPSSAKLFVNWYLQMSNGTDPTDEDVALWACFDVVESALYRAAMIPQFTADNFLAPEEVFWVLYKSDITTPLGRVDFDVNNVNSNAASIVAQANPLTGSIELVAPTQVASAQFVYPMPTWDERVYRWSLFKFPEVKITMLIATVCSFILLAMAFTMVWNRKDLEVRMLHHLHMASMCLAACITCWSLVFLWQADMQQWQCWYYLWATYLPASFMLQMVNMKAYRLSTFLRAGDKRPKPFPHIRVLILTLGLTLISVAFLLFITLVQPLKLKTIVIDRYRLSLDIHQCQLGTLANSLLYVLELGHLIMSAICVFQVRYGFEGFRDGVAMKEAFVIFYGFLFVATVMNFLPVSIPTQYLIRFIGVALGATLFCIRILFSRCIKFWVPAIIRSRVSELYEKHVKPLLPTVLTPSATFSSNSMMQAQLVDDIGDSPVYAVDVPEDSCLVEMERVINDPNRVELFESVAKSSMVFESLTFLRTVLEFKRRSEALVQEQSACASNQMKDFAKAIVQNHIGSTSMEEVNVSARCAETLRKALDDWTDNVPIVSAELAQKALVEDALKRVEIFSTAYKEISILLYQNIWNKFRTLETQQRMTGASSTEFFRALPSSGSISREKRSYAPLIGKVTPQANMQARTSPQVQAQESFRKVSSFRSTPMPTSPPAPNQELVDLQSSENLNLPRNQNSNDHLSGLSLIVMQTAAATAKEEEQDEKLD